MALRSLFQKDFGVSEGIANLIRTGPGIQPGKAPAVNNQTLYQTPAFVTPNPASNNTNNLPSATSQGFWSQYSTPRPQGRVLGVQDNLANIRPSGGGLASNPDAGTKNDPNAQQQNTPDAYAETQQRLEEEANARTAQAQRDAEGIFNPLIGSADTQIGRLASERGDLERGVNAGAQASRDLVGKQLESSINVLGQQESGVREQTGKSLRNLAEDQRNITTSTARQLGARGAGDTSAGDYAGAAIGRQGLKQRGSALESQATGLREIEGRRFEAKNIADQENTRIEQAKQQQLSSLAADFQNIQRQLETAKATATSDQRRYIAEQQNALKSELSQRLSDLEGEVRQRKAALSDWGAQQETLLQNSMRLIQQKGAYDASDVYGQLDKASQIAGRLGLQAGPQAGQEIQDTYIPGFQPGLFQPKKEDDLGLGGLFTEEELASLGA